MSDEQSAGSEGLPAPEAEAPSGEASSGSESASEKEPRRLSHDDLALLHKHLLELVKAKAPK